MRRYLDQLFDSLNLNFGIWYRWSVTTPIIEPMLDLLPAHVISTAFAKPKLAPTAKSRAVALARIGRSRCTPLSVAEDLLSAITFHLAQHASKNLDMEMCRSQVDAFNQWCESGDIQAIAGHVEAQKAAGPGLCLGVKKGAHPTWVLT